MRWQWPRYGGHPRSLVNDFPLFRFGASLTHTHIHTLFTSRRVGTGYNKTNDERADITSNFRGVSASNREDVHVINRSGFINRSDVSLVTLRREIYGYISGIMIGGNIRDLLAAHCLNVLAGKVHLRSPATVFSSRFHANYPQCVPETEILIG